MLDSFPLIGLILRSQDYVDLIYGFNKVSQAEMNVEDIVRNQT